mgnify:CR=1 FL=1
MKQVWKRRAVAAAVVVLVGTSVYLNWRYAGDVADTSKVLGQSTLVNGETAEAQADTADTAGDDYFSTARLSRKQARDTAISMLEEAKGEENASEEVANEASETLQVLAGYTVAETQIENLVVAKGYADCVAFMGADSISGGIGARRSGGGGRSEDQGYRHRGDILHSRPDQDHGSGNVRCKIGVVFPRKKWYNPILQLAKYQ